MQQSKILRSTAYQSVARTEYGKIWNLWLQRSRTRRQLKMLLQNDQERLYSDLGLNTAQVQAECSKWFWQS